MIYKVTEGTSVWFTGPPASGKSTIAYQIRKIVHEEFDLPVIVLDGDVVRPIIAEDLGYGVEDRFKSLQKYILLSKLLIEAPIIVLVVVVNHSEKQRKLARRSHAKQRFFEISIDTPLEECYNRDPKGHYKRAASDHDSADLVGWDITYEKPEHAELVIETMSVTPEEAARKVIALLTTENIIMKEDE